MIQKKNIMIATGAIAAVGAVAQNVPEKPNVVFILCDDLGYADVGYNGQEYIKTPNIDRLAKQGMIFTQHYCGSAVSAPSRASLMTGQHTGHTKVRDNKEYWNKAGKVQYGICEDFDLVGQEPLDPNRYTVSQLFHDNGYRTGLFGKWGNGYEGSEATPLKMGFDEFYGFICQFQAHLLFPNFLNRGNESTNGKEIREVLEENVKFPMYGTDYEKRTQYSADLIHKEAMMFLDKQTADKPFFAYLTYTLPHAELRQPNDSILDAYSDKFCVEKSFGGQQGSRYNPVQNAHAQFAAIVTRLDTYVGQVMDLLEKKGLKENTIIIFTSDNGPHREGGAEPDFFNKEGKYRGYKTNLYEGGIHAPMVAAGPGIKAGSSSDHVSAFWDYLPTFAEILNVQLPQETDGISMYPTLFGKGEQKKHDFLYWEFRGRAVRKGNWKLIRIGGKTGTYKLFDLATDQHEDHDLKDKYPEKVKELEAIMEQEHSPSDIWNIK